MQLRYVIILLILVLFVGGIGAWVYVMNSAPDTETEIPLQPVGQGSNYTQTVTVPSSGSIEPVTVDPDKIFTDLFSALSATRVQFLPVNNTSGGVQGDVYALYAGTMPTGTPLRIAMVDLQGDASAEALVYQETSTTCGSGGCSFDIYSKAGGAWKLIFEALAYEWIGILTTKTNGYADLLIPVKGDPGFMTRVVKFSWNGTSYQSQSIAAVWDGEEFDILR